LNLLRFISSDSLAPDSTKKRSHFRGARQLLLTTNGAAKVAWTDPNLHLPDNDERGG